MTVQNPSQKASPKERHQLAVWVDVVMIILVVLDVTWIIFDGLMEVEIIRGQVFHFLFPEFTSWYQDHINENFLFYETSIFVSIFLTELLIRWIIAIVRKTYDKWFFYPLIHWYDVLGCIPFSGFRLLRFIRVVVLVYRLHRWGIIDLKDYSIFRLLAHYYTILVEEVSDRVAVNLLEEAKSEIQRGAPLAPEIIRTVVRPNQQTIVKWSAANVQRGIHEHYVKNKAEVRQHLEQVIEKAVKENKEINDLHRLPMVGRRLANSIEQSIADITFRVIDEITSDLADRDKSPIMEAIVEAVFEVVLKAIEMESEGERLVSKKIISTSIDLMIERVKEKKWKIREAAQNEEN